MSHWQPFSQQLRGGASPGEGVRYAGAMGKGQVCEGPVPQPLAASTQDSQAWGPSRLSSVLPTSADSSCGSCCLRSVGWPADHTCTRRNPEAGRVVSMLVLRGTATLLRCACLPACVRGVSACIPLLHPRGQVGVSPWVHRGASIPACPVGASGSRSLIWAMHGTGGPFLPAMPGAVKTSPPRAPWG